MDHIRINAEIAKLVRELSELPKPKRRLYIPRNSNRVDADQPCSLYNKWTHSVCAEFDSKEDLVAFLKAEYERLA